MERFRQDPTEDAFVQEPYAFYDRLRAAGPLSYWEEYGMPCAASHDVVSALLRDRRFGREDPDPPPRPPHQAEFWAVEDHSMLEAEPPRHTRLRSQVLRAFTSARVAALAPGVEALAHRLVDDFPSGPFDLVEALCAPLPVRVIARLLGVPEDDAPMLLAWSHAMVGMYQAGRDEEAERAAARAAGAFRGYLADILSGRARAPEDDLLSQLLAVERDGRLSRDETVATAILLLNAGHEATVHTLANGIHGLLSRGEWPPRASDALVEEVLRHDPPLHLFTRYAKEACEVFGHRFRRGDRVGLLLAAANRDPAVYAEQDRFDPARFEADRAAGAARAPAPLSFGAGIHFCIGAPLARLEIGIALSVLGARLPGLRRAGPARYAPIYHFHGLGSLPVAA
jgi:cytochrome P450